MKTTIAVALAACVSSSLMAQTLVKQDIITFSLTGGKQLSVSTSGTILNAGTWSAGPMFYKTTPVKVTDQDIIHYIGATLYQNAKHYSSKAKLVLVQGELSGFFNMTPDLALSRPDDDNGVAPEAGALLGSVDPWFNDNGGSADLDPSTVLANSTDSLVFQLDNGRHWDVNPLNHREYPVGHLQPWGQIYVMDPDGTDDNVTYFFAISIQECYDCFFLNSFITTANFKVSTTAQNGPPCCGTESVIVGSGKDEYYMTLSFDDSRNNPYLVEAGPGGENNPLYIGDEIGNAVVGTPSTYIQGIKGTIDGDAIVPDTIYNHTLYNAAFATASAAVIAGGGTALQAHDAGVAAGDLAGYIDLIKSGIGLPSPYQARFTLNGVLTYSWKLAQIDKQDISPDFMGTGVYVANGYGFIGLFCSLFNTATVTFSEKPVKSDTTELDMPWTDSWIGIGSEWVTLFDDTGAPIGLVTPYENWVNNGSPGYNWGGGENNNQWVVPIYPTPINVSTSLSYHENFNNQYPPHLPGNLGWSAWPTPAWIDSWYLPQ